MRQRETMPLSILVVLLLAISLGGSEALWNETTSFTVKDGAPHPPKLSFPGPPSSSAGADTYIVGGDISASGEFPWYVVAAGGLSLCGGSLIHPQVVLTAAHCASAFAVGYPVEIGLTDRRSFDNIVRRVTKTLRHPDYDERFATYDFMLLLLDAPVNSVETIPLNRNENVPEVGEEVSVMGFGQVSGAEPGDGPTSYVLRDVDVFVESNAVCAIKYWGVIGFDGFSRFEFDEDAMMCASNPDGDKDSCYGDSGSPAITRDGVQVGVVSSGAGGCGSIAIPGIYARVSSVVEWIDDGICQFTGECEGGGGGGGGGTNPPPDPSEYRTIALRFKYDDYPYETSWSFIQGSEVLYIGPQYVPSRQETWESVFENATPGSYTFRVDDTACDGLLSLFGDGYYEIYQLHSNGFEELLAYGDPYFDCTSEVDFVVS